MTVRSASPAARTRFGMMLAGLLLFCAAAGGLAYACNYGFPWRTPTAEPKLADQPEPVLGKADFAHWPKARPDAVIVLSGQTFGLLQPCGCSARQLGGLERRANLLAQLRGKGWPVVGADLGDLYQPKGAIPEQSVLKYGTAMNALREMGYVAVGLGVTEFEGGVLNLLAQYSLQKEQPPFVLAGNVVGKGDGKQVPREQFFPAPPGGTRPLVGLLEVADVGGVPVGFVGVVGKDAAEAARKADPLVEFTDVPATLKTAAAALAAHPR
ncbi:MAG: hypothetical protein K2P78_08755, partial [Gemmataceae bacterium]|nr:hypothetical protein [Gemmataceae bacterium]